MSTEDTRDHNKRDRLLLTVKREDDYPTLEATLTDADGEVIDLSDSGISTIEVHADHAETGTAVINSTATVVDAPVGKVEYPLSKTETILEGRHYLEFVIQYTDGRTRTVPQSGYYYLDVDQPVSRGELDPGTIDGSTSVSVGYLSADEATIGTLSVTNAPVDADDAVRKAEHDTKADQTAVDSLSTTVGAKADKDGGGTGTLTNYASVGTKQATIGESRTESHPVYDLSHPSHGVAADGVTDDRAAIQSVIDTAASNGGGTVYFPEGDYLINGALVGRGSVSLRGAGAYRSVIHQQTAAEHCIDLAGASHLSVESLGMTHDHGLAAQDSGQGLFSGSGLENVTIKNCQFTEPARQGVGLWSGANSNIRFLNNDIRDCVRAGVVIFGEGIHVRGNYVNRTGDDGIALNTVDTTRCSVADNIVISGAGVGEQTGGGIKFHGQNVLVSGNLVMDANQYGIRGQIPDGTTNPGQYPTRNVISNNIIRNLTDINPDTAASAAIEMREYEDIVVRGNSIYDIAGYDGIYLRNEASTTIYADLSNNYIQDARFGIYLVQGQEFVSATDNTFVNATRVVQISGAVSYFLFRNNQGYGTIDRNVNFSGVAAGEYAIVTNWIANSTATNIVEGSVSGGTIYNYLNTPDADTAGIRDGATSYQAIRWSSLVV